MSQLTDTARHDSSTVKWLRCPLGVGLALHLKREPFLRDGIGLLIVDSVRILDDITRGTGIGQSPPEGVPVERILQLPVLRVNSSDGRVTPEGWDCTLITDNSW